MSFFQLQVQRRTSIIQKKQRISLIVQYSLDSFFAFYKDQSFQQINSHNNEIVNQGKLQFLPLQSLFLTHRNRIVLLGLDKTKSLCCCLIDVQNKCAIETREISNANPEKATKFYLYESYPNQQANFYIVMIQKNVQNGLAISAYDFQNNLWCHQILGLPSKFLNYFYINTAINNHLYKDQSEKECFTFALVALGQRFDSINYSKMKMSYEYKENELIFKLTFVITRELKIKSHFIFVGGLQFDHSTILLVGNSRQQSQKAGQFINLPAFVKFDPNKIQNNEPQEIKAHPMFAKTFAERIQDLHFRGVVGQYEGNLICQLRTSTKLTYLARINLNHQQEIIQLPAQKITLSIKKDSFFSYNLHCQYFFEKIKGSPSKIDSLILKICKKSNQYEKFLKKKYPWLNNGFIEQILNVL